MTRGGKRPRAGRPPSTGTGSSISLYLATADRAELEAVLRPGQTLASFIRTAAMKEARRRK